MFIFYSIPTISMKCITMSLPLILLECECIRVQTVSWKLLQESVSADTGCKS